MSLRSKKIITVMTATGAAALLGLTGCSGQNAATETNDAPEKGVFEFQTPRYGTDTGKLTIRIPEGLVDAMGDESGELLVASADVTQLELDSSKYCAFEITPKYLGDAPDVLAESSMTEAEWDEQSENEFLSQTGIETMAEADELIAAGGADAEMLSEYKANYITPYVAAPAWVQLTEAQEIADLDESEPVAGTYYSDDYSTLTHVQPCAVSPEEDASGDSFQFPIAVDGKVDTLATIALTIMKAGTITVTSAEIDGFEVDSDGNWIEQ